MSIKPAPASQRQAEQGPPKGNPTYSFTPPPTTSHPCGWLARSSQVAATEQQLFTLTPGCPLPEPLGEGADRETLSYLGVAQGATVLVGMRDE